MSPSTVAHQAALSMKFSRQEYWSGLPCPSVGDLPDPGIEPGYPALQADSLWLGATQESPFALLSMEFSRQKIFQARILEWVAISSSRESSQPMDQTQVSYVSCISRQILYHCARWEAQ